MKKYAQLLMKKFNVGHTEKVNSEISDLSGKFEKSLAKLWESKYSSKLIRKQLQNVIFKWRCFMDSTDEKEIEDVLEKNGELLIEMDKAVSMYEKS